MSAAACAGSLRGAEAAGARQSPLRPARRPGGVHAIVTPLPAAPALGGQARIT